MSKNPTEKEIHNALEKSKIIPKTESSIIGNIDHLNNAIKTTALDSIDKLREKTKDPEIDSIYDFIDKDALTEFILQLLIKRLQTAMSLCNLPHLRKGCSENMHQIYKKTSITNCGFNKGAKQLH